MEWKEFSDQNHYREFHNDIHEIKQQLTLNFEQREKKSNEIKGEDI